MTQTIIVILIGIACVIYLLHKLFRCFLRKNTRTNKCDDCPGCILKPKNNREK